MSARRISYGKCFFCEKPFAKNAIRRHLQSCPARKEAIAQESQQRGRAKRLFHLQIEGTYRPEYWMHVEIPATATLADLDGFLRAIWLECCGHLSAFTIGDVEYEYDIGMPDEMWADFPGQEEQARDDADSEHGAETLDQMWRSLFGQEPQAQDDVDQMLDQMLRDIFGEEGEARSMNVPLQDVLSPGMKFSYAYDFGTTTHLTLQVIGEREGKIPRRKWPVRVMARNYAPLYLCEVCEQPARWIHTWEWTVYCREHAEENKDWLDAFLPLVNSPRTGECGYTGPWDRKLSFEEHYTPPEKA